MGYRVVYGQMPRVEKRRSGRPLRLQALTAVFLLVFTLTVRQAWPEGQKVLRQFLIPGEPTVTEEAFRDMLEDIQQGESIGDAVTAFCTQIVEYGIQEAY